MEHPFFPTATTRPDAVRWLTTSEKLLSGRDLMGSKSFATRARDADPTLAPAEEILAIVDTLLVGDRRIRNNQQDWYSILRLTPQQGQDSELVASRYRNLALILNPQRNKYPLAEEAFRLVVDAWSVLSNPSRKAIYDKELSFYFQAQQQQQQQPPDPFHNHSTTTPQNFIFFGAGGPSTVAQSEVHAGGSNFFRDQQVHTQPQQQNLVDFRSGSNSVYGSGSKSSQEPAYKQAPPSYTYFSGNATRASGSIQEPVNDKQKQPMRDYSNVSDKDNTNAGETVEDDEVNEVEIDTTEAEDEDDALPFWTACPYCYYMYQYSGVYSDCTLRCQNCRRAFQVVQIPAPPPVMAGQEGYFCCWGFFPLGVSMENWGKNKYASSTWTPFSPMFSGPRNDSKKGVEPKNSGPRIYVDEDEVFVEISDSSGSDKDWQNDREPKNKKVKSVKGKGTNGMRPASSVKKVQDDKRKNFNLLKDGFASRNGVVDMLNETASEPSKKGAPVNARKQPNRVAKNLGKLDLNVELSNETEEPAPKVNQGNAPGRGEDDNIEGIGFFEGLDEFLSSLPILNVVGDDKVVKAA